MTRRFFFLSLVFAVCLAVGVGPAAAEYFVGLTHGTNKHRPEFSFEPADTYLLRAAQNEWEPFQVLVRDDAGVENVDVAVTEFTGPGDPITEIELYRVHYIMVPIEKVSHQPPDLSKVGMWPDALVPFVDHFVGEIRDGAPFNVDADFSQAVFVDVFIPDGQTPGEYTATVTVTADGRDEWTGVVTLSVWDFAIPSENSIDSNYGYSRNSPCTWHAAHGGVTDCATLNQWYYLEFARHRMGLYNWRMNTPGATWNDGASTFDWDWAAFDAAHAEYLDGGFYRDDYSFSGMRLPGPPGGRPAHVPAADWEHEYWKGWGEHFEAMGWDEKIWYYMPDEPMPEEYPALRDLSQRIHNAHPILQPMVTEQYEAELDGDIDIWCPDEPLFSDSMPWPPYPEKYDEVRAAGQKTWWYNCVSANVGFDYANHMVDHASTYMRAWLWMTRRYDFQGLLFWQTVYLYAYQDVWEDQFAYRFVCQGDGTVIYPGTPDKIGGVEDIPVASLRMKYLREGMEDYEYFHILDQGGYETWVDDVSRTVTPKTWQFEHDWEKLLDWRRKVAEKILGELDETPPDPPASLTAAAQVEAIEIAWTPPTAPDLAGYDIWYAIQDGDELFGGSADAAATGALLLGLMPGREYTVWVTAYDENGNRSGPSDAVTATPQGAGDDDDGDDDDERNGVDARSSYGDGDDDDDDDDDDLAAGCGGGGER